MRNVLVFPDGTEQDFQYPSNRVIREGDRFELSMLDQSVHYLTIDRIEQGDGRISYYLKF